MSTSDKRHTELIGIDYDNMPLLLRVQKKVDQLTRSSKDVDSFIVEKITRAITVCSSKSDIIAIRENVGSSLFLRRL